MKAFEHFHPNVVRVFMWVVVKGFQCKANHKSKKREVKKQKKPSQKE